MLKLIPHENAHFMKRLVLIGWAAVLVLAGCAGDRDAITEEFLPGTGPTTTSTSLAGPGVTTTSTPGEPVSIESLIEHVRMIRQIDFAPPEISYRPEAEVIAGYRALHGLPSTGNEQFDAAYLQMLGILEEGDPVSALADPCAVPGYYDPASGSLVVAEDVGELTPLGRRQLIGEITAAATDAVFGWGTALAAEVAAGDKDGAAALWGLVRGDAEFHAAQYAAEILNATDRFAITLEEISCRQERPDPPAFVSVVEAYDREVGRDFVEELIATGGRAAVDGAYRQQPVSSEQVYHPSRYAADEPVVPVQLDAIGVSGFTEVDAGGFGERIFRAILSEGVGNAQALQAATGWGGDAYRVLWNGTDVVLVLAFEGDEERDARELAETLGGWASSSLGVGAGRPDNTGLAFEGEDYAFVAHDGSSMLLVVSNDAGAGRDVRNVFWPQW